VALQKRLADDSPGVIDYRLHLAQSYHILVNVLRDTDQYRDAEAALRQAVPLFEQLVHELPAMPQVQEGLARTHRNLGYLLWETDRPREATEPFRQARTLYERLVEKNPDAPLLAYHLAWFLADCPDPCCADAPRAIRLAEQAVARPFPDPVWWNVLGMARYRAGEWQAALDPLNRSVASQADGRSWDQFYLAMAHWKLGHHHLARDLYHQACTEMESITVGKVKLRRLRAEAAALLGVPWPADP
jgi:tetratricopeptide (TPR) repeat protein